MISSSEIVLPPTYNYRVTLAAAALAVNFIGSLSPIYLLTSSYFIRPGGTSSRKLFPYFRRLRYTRLQSTNSYDASLYTKVYFALRGFLAPESPYSAFDLGFFHTLLICDVHARYPPNEAAALISRLLFEFLRHSLLGRI